MFTWVTPPNNINTIINTLTEHCSSDLSVPDGATPHKENKEKSPQILQQIVNLYQYKIQLLLLLGSLKGCRTHFAILGYFWGFLGVFHDNKKVGCINSINPILSLLYKTMTATE